MEKPTADPKDLQAKALARWENEGGSARSRPHKVSASGASLGDVEPSSEQTMTSFTEAPLTEAVAAFDTVRQLQAAIDELLESGFDRAELSLLADSDTVDSKIGRMAVAAVEDDPASPRGPYVSPEAMGAAEGGIIGSLLYIGGTATAAVIALAGGPISAIVLGGVAAGGLGGLVGSGLAALMGLHRAAFFDEQLARGGLVLWVRTWSPERERRALDILRRHAGQDAHVHAFGGAGAVRSDAALGTR
jgi:hypothetical protein